MKGGNSYLAPAHFTFKFMLMLLKIRYIFSQDLNFSEDPKRLLMVADVLALCYMVLGGKIFFCLPQCKPDQRCQCDTQEVKPPHTVNM